MNLETFVKNGQAAQGEIDRQIGGKEQLLIATVTPAPPALRRPPAGRRRRAVFKVSGGRAFDGAHVATVVITQDFISVRPKGRRRTFELLLADVARGIIFDVVQAELRDKKAARARDRKKGGRR